MKITNVPHRPRIGRRALLAAAAALVAGRTAAQPAWPDRPQRWVVPFPAGGVLDALTRAVAEPLQAASRQAIVVENLPGAAGNLGIQAVARAAGDGSTWLFIPQGNVTINATLLRDVPFQWGRDFKPVTLLAYAPNVMVVHPSVPAHNVRELAALAKSRPDALSYGSPGIGSSLHLVGELFKREAGIEMLHVPYKGTTQALQDAVGAQVQVLFGAVPTLLPMIRQGKLRPLAVTTARRAELLPDVPTLKEAGYAIDVQSWYGVMAPAATPDGVIERAQSALAGVLSSPSVRERLQSQGLSAVASRPAEFKAQIQRETAMWAKVIRESGIKPE